jgi:hypothetical protein
MVKIQNHLRGQHQVYKDELALLRENNKCIEELERRTNGATKI